jgi:hypothetical protein
MAALLGAVAAPAASAKGYMDSFDLANRIEARGLAWHGKRYAVDMALCSGLRRYGVKKTGFMDQYHVFKCTIQTANERFASARITAATNSRYVVNSFKFSW